jgi:hypothetical protein
MTKIYKTETPRASQYEIVKANLLEKVDGLYTGDVSNLELPVIKLYVDVQPSYFEIKMSYDITTTSVVVPSDPEGTEPVSETKTYYLLWHRVDLTSILNNTGASDQTLWAVSDNVKLVTGEYHKYTEEGLPTYWPINSSELVDILSGTIVSKPSVVLSSSSPASDANYTIFVPYLTGLDMTQCVYKIQLNQGLTYEIDPTSPALASIIEDNIKVADLIAPITVTGPSVVNPDSTIVVQVSTTPGIYAVYLEQVNGILPKVKVLLDSSGNGSFKVLTSGMDIGETVSVKVGFKQWANKVTYTKTIS